MPSKTYIHQTTYRENFTLSPLRKLYDYIDTHNKDRHYFAVKRREVKCEKFR